MPQNHQINKQRIVISTPGKGTGQISDEIQKAKEQTSRRIENLFDQHIPADRLVEINSLHLDLGLLPTTNFIAEYQRRLTLLLENELRKLSRSPGFEKYVQTLPVLLSDRYERAVRYFLQGYEPGLQGEPGFEITAVVKQLLEQDSRRLATALEKVWQSEIATLRAQRQLAPTIYRKIESLRVTDSFASQPVAEKLPGKEISQALEQYFVKGTFPAWFKPASLLSVEQYFFKIEGAALRKLAIKVERMLTKTEVRKRLAETLSTDSLKKVFFVLPELQKPLQELEILEAALTKEAVRSAFFQAVEFKEILLRYIAARNESEKLKARILLELIQQSGGKQELLKGFLKDKNVRNSYFKRLLTNPRKTAKILQEKRTPKPSPGNMGILLRYLENGILTAGLDFTTLLSKMLVSHSVLLRKTLQDNWHLYPVRYRLAYQTDEKQLIELMELLFSEVEGFQRFETLFDEEPSFATSTRRHLYFAFFNLMAHSTNKGFTQKSFNEKFVLVLSALFPELKMDLGELAHLGGGHPAKLGRHLLKAVDENSDVQEEIKPVRETLEEFVLKGSSSEAYQKLAGKKRLLLFFDEVIAGKELTASMLLQKRVHRTFWSEIVTTLKAGQLMELTAQLILFQANAWNGIRLELMRLEIELGLKPKTLYPLKRKGMFLILQTLASGNFALSEKQFAEFYFQKAWDQLKSKSGTSTHQNLLNRLWIKSAHPEFQYRLPLTYNWLRGIDPLAGARKNRLQELKQGISDPFWDKYTSIDLVKFYLQKSALPSWSSLKNKKEVSAILEQLVENQNPKLARMAVAIQKEYVQLRLINMLKPESFYRFLNYLDPERYATFSLVIDDLKSKASPFSKVPIKVFELFLQLQLFNLLGSPRAMQDGEAVQDLLQSASLKYNLAYAKLVAGLHKGLKSLKSNILKVVVQREYSALQKPEARAWRKSTTTGQTREGSASADVLKHYFLKGDIPQWSTTKGKNELAKLIGQGLKSNPSEVMEILHSLKKKRQGLARFMELLRLADFERIFGLLAKGRKESFKKTVDDLLRFQKLVKNLDAGGLDFKRTLYAALLKFLVEEETGFYQDKKLAASLVKAISVKYGVNH